MLVARFRSLFTFYGRLFLALLLVAVAVDLRAQVATSTIAGVVTDGAGAVIPGAHIVATLSSTGQQRESNSNGAGEYVIPQLAPGNYRVTVTTTGFQTAVIQNVILDIAERAIINVTLQVGQVSEEVTVSGTTTPLLETETASLGKL
jgi:Carboxypeptidase regulatory-like domain